MFCFFFLICYNRLSFKAFLFSFYSVTEASFYIVSGVMTDDDDDDDNDDRAFISGSIAVATVAMPVVVLFIVLSDGFCRIAVTLRMKREPCVCPMQRAGHNCCVPAVDPFQTGFNMSLSAFF